MLFQLSFSGLLAQLLVARLLFAYQMGVCSLSLAMPLGGMASLGTCIWGCKSMECLEKVGVRRPPWCPRKFSCPEQLAEQFVSYARYIEDNPLVLPKIFYTEDGGASTESCGDLAQ